MKPRRVSGLASPRCACLPEPARSALSDTDPIAAAVGSMPFCVCVPSRNEQDRLGVLLEALAGQDIGRVVPVAFCLNNTSDGSMAVIESARHRWSGRLQIHVETVTFSPELAHAGSARHRAMALGSHVLAQRPDAVLISTDADTRPPADWVRTNLSALAERADVVGGRLVIDQQDGPPPSMVRARALWDRYWVRVREIEDSVDPVAWDPPPRHGDHTGASLALRISTLKAAGGVPVVPLGEDRALVAAAVAVGARLRHPTAVWTRVSARTTGRAPGGMADHLALMSNDLAADRPMMAPSLDQWRERAAWRRGMRGQGRSARFLTEAEALLPPMVPDMRLSDLLETA